MASMILDIAHADGDTTISGVLQACYHDDDLHVTYADGMTQVFTDARIAQAFDNETIRSEVC